MPRFYQYIIYKMYTWRLEKNDDTPITTVICLLTIAHLCQLGLVYSIVSNLFGTSPNLIKPKSALAYILMLVFIGINYLVFYNKAAWERYIERFKNESEEQRVRGNYLAIAYYVGSIVLFFVGIITYFSLRR